MLQVAKDDANCEKISTRGRPPQLQRLLSARRARCEKLQEGTENTVFKSMGTLAMYHYTRDVVRKSCESNEDDDYGIRQWHGRPRQALSRSICDWLSYWSTCIVAQSIDVSHVHTRMKKATDLPCKDVFKLYAADAVGALR